MLPPPNPQSIYYALSWNLSYPALYYGYFECGALRAIWLKMDCGLLFQITAAQRRWELVSHSHDGTGAHCKDCSTRCSGIQAPSIYDCHPQRVASNCLQCVNTLSTFQPVRKGRKGVKERANLCLLKAEPS